MHACLCFVPSPCYISVSGGERPLYLCREAGRHDCPLSSLERETCLCVLGKRGCVRGEREGKALFSLPLFKSLSTTWRCHTLPPRLASREEGGGRLQRCNGGGALAAAARRFRRSACLHALLPLKHAGACCSYAHHSWPPPARLLRLRCEASGDCYLLQEHAEACSLLICLSPLVTSQSSAPGVSVGGGSAASLPSSPSLVFYETMFCWLHSIPLPFYCLLPGSLPVHRLGSSKCIMFYHCGPLLPPGNDVPVSCIHLLFLLLLLTHSSHSYSTISLFCMTLLLYSYLLLCNASAFCLPLCFCSATCLLLACFISHLLGGLQAFSFLCSRCSRASLLCRRPSPMLLTSGRREGRLFLLQYGRLWALSLTFLILYELFRRPPAYGGCATIPAVLSFCFCHVLLSVRVGGGGSVLDRRLACPCAPAY